MNSQEIDSKAREMFGEKADEVLKAAKGNNMKAFAAMLNPKQKADLKKALDNPAIVEQVKNYLNKK